jgi:hypothetical protein
LCAGINRHEAEEEEALQERNSDPLEDIVEQNQVLIEAIRKLALAGEQAGFSVEEMIELLKTGVSLETLLDLVCVARIDTLISVTKLGR